MEVSTFSYVKCFSTLKKKIALHSQLRLASCASWINKWSCLSKWNKLAGQPGLEGQFSSLIPGSLNILRSTPEGAQQCSCHRCPLPEPRQKLSGWVEWEEGREDSEWPAFTHLFCKGEKGFSLAVTVQLIFFSLNHKFRKWNHLQIFRIQVNLILWKFNIAYLKLLFDNNSCIQHQHISMIYSRVTGSWEIGKNIHAFF